MIALISGDPLGPAFSSAAEVAESPGLPPPNSHITFLIHGAAAEEGQGAGRPGKHSNSSVNSTRPQSAGHQRNRYQPSVTSTASAGKPQPARRRVQPSALEALPHSTHLLVTRKPKTFASSAWDVGASPKGVQGRPAEDAVSRHQQLNLPKAAAAFPQRALSLRGLRLKDSEDSEDSSGESEDSSGESEDSGDSNLDKPLSVAFAVLTESSTSAAAVGASTSGGGSSLGALAALGSSSSSNSTPQYSHANALGSSGSSSTTITNHSNINVLGSVGIPHSGVAKASLLVDGGSTRHSEGLNPICSTGAHAASSAEEGASAVDPTTGSGSSSKETPPGPPSSCPSHTPAASRRTFPATRYHVELKPPNKSGYAHALYQASLELSPWERDAVGSGDEVDDGVHRSAMLSSATACIQHAQYRKAAGRDTSMDGRFVRYGTDESSSGWEPTVSPERSLGPQQKYMRRIESLQRAVSSSGVEGAARGAPTAGLASPSIIHTRGSCSVAPDSSGVASPQTTATVDSTSRPCQMMTDNGLSHRPPGTAGDGSSCDDLRLLRLRGLQAAASKSAAQSAPLLALRPGTCPASGSTPSTLPKGLPLRSTVKRSSSDLEMDGSDLVRLDLDPPGDLTSQADRQGPPSREQKMRTVRFITPTSQHQQKQQQDQEEQKQQQKSEAKKTTWVGTHHSTAAFPAAASPLLRRSASTPRLHHLQHHQQCNNSSNIVSNRGNDICSNISSNNVSKISGNISNDISSNKRLIQKLLPQRYLSSNGLPAAKSHTQALQPTRRKVPGITTAPTAPTAAAATSPTTPTAAGAPARQAFKSGVAACGGPAVVPGLNFYRLSTPGAAALNSTAFPATFAAAAAAAAAVVSCASFPAAPTAAAAAAAAVANGPMGQLSSSSSSPSILSFGHQQDIASPPPGPRPQSSRPIQRDPTTITAAFAAIAEVAAAAAALPATAAASVGAAADSPTTAVTLQSLGSSSAISHTPALPRLLRDQLLLCRSPGHQAVEASDTINGGLGSNSSLQSPGRARAVPCLAASPHHSQLQQQLQQQLLNSSSRRNPEDVGLGYRGSSGSIPHSPTARSAVSPASPRSTTQKQRQQQQQRQPFSRSSSGEPAALLSDLNSRGDSSHLTVSRLRGLPGASATAARMEGRSDSRSRSSRDGLNERVGPGRSGCGGSLMINLPGSGQRSETARVHDRSGSAANALKEESGNAGSGSIDGSSGSAMAAGTSGPGMARRISEKLVLMYKSFQAKVRGNGTDAFVGDE